MHVIYNIELLDNLDTFQDKVERKYIQAVEQICRWLIQLLISLQVESFSSKNMKMGKVF